MTARMHPFTLTFAEAGLERAYRDDLFERYQRRQAPVVYAMILVATTSLVLLDWLVIPDVFEAALALRFGVVVPLELMCFALISSRHFQRLHTAILLLPMLAGWWLFFQLGLAGDTDIDAAFRGFDKNADGYLSRGEFALANQQFWLSRDARAPGHRLIGP